MLLGVHLSDNVRASRRSTRFRVNVLLAFVIACSLVVASPALAQNSSKGDGDHNEKNECPPETSKL
jgi:hypothetical protein